MTLYLAGNFGLPTTPCIENQNYTCIISSSIISCSLPDIPIFPKHVELYLKKTSIEFHKYCHLYNIYPYYTYKICNTKWMYNVYKLFFILFSKMFGRIESIMHFKSNKPSRSFQHCLSMFYSLWNIFNIYMVAL